MKRQGVFRRFRTHTRGQKGQVSVMIGMIMLTFILFFCFVVNTGMLVNAKINLQNAADLAAYAGAAVQARQLNQISYLNYEMRREYKKFLFRYLVIGGMAQNSHNSTDTGTRHWYAEHPNEFQSPADDVPAVCVIFNQSDNYCHLKALPKINIPPNNALDMINSTLIGQLQEIEKVRLRSCAGIGRTNIQLLLLWLWNTDPSLKTLDDATAADPESAAILQRIKGIAQGLGLVPRESILRQRIYTLQYYINSKAETGINKEQVDTLATSADPAHYERTIQAFNSAYHTLGDHTYEGSDIVMDELLPPGTQGASLLGLRPIEVPIDTFAMDMQIGGYAAGSSQGSQVISSGNAQDCKPVPEKFSISKVPVGVWKVPEILTYYAVKLQAKAKVMFSPFGELKLKAYAAAQPFGSRIGPPLNESNWVNPSPSASGVSLPWLPIKTSGSSGKDWAQQEVIWNMYETGLNQAQPSSVTGDVLQTAYRYAMAPNPWEAGKYNIITDMGDDSFQKFFKEAGGKYSFWAPVFPIDKGGVAGGIDDEITKMVTDLNPAKGSMEDLNKETTGAGTQGFKTSMIKGFKSYIQQQLKEGKGEDGEGYNVVSITDPIFLKAEPGGKAKPLSVKDYILTNPKLIKTSWAAVKDGNLAAMGRIGYSVKIISFRSLLQKQGSSNGSNQWQNVFPTDSDSEGDMAAIEH